MEEVLERLGIKNLFVYHQEQVDERHIEFGWVPAEEIDLAVPIMVAKDPEDPEWNNATTVEDNATFFLRLTGLTAEEFIERWAPSPRELQLFWRSTRPNATNDQHEFVLNLANLIKDKTSFKMYGKTYKVVEFSPEELGIEEEKTEEEVQLEQIQQMVGVLTANINSKKKRRKKRVKENEESGD